MKALKAYRSKRDFRETAEPSGAGRRRPRRAGRIFVVQQHAARRLHWDFRLELNGVLKSWAVTNEPSDDPATKRLAIETEDHPLEYAGFHGRIPAGQYGAGMVRIWDHGNFECPGDLAEEIEIGRVKVILRGRRLRGSYVLVRTDSEKTGPRSRWIFFKGRPEPVALRFKRRIKTDNRSGAA